MKVDRVSAGRRAPSSHLVRTGLLVTLHTRQSLETHQKGKLAADRRRRWGGALMPSEVMSTLLRLKGGVWICRPLIWHRYLCPHLCLLSSCTTWAALPGSWQHPFTSCYCIHWGAVRKPSLSFFVWKSGCCLLLMHSPPVLKWWEYAICFPVRKSLAVELEYHSHARFLYRPKRQWKTRYDKWDIAVRRLQMLTEPAAFNNS